MPGTGVKAEIHGVLVKDLARHADGRGWLAELFRTDELEDDIRPVMSYVSMTHPGIARGPHEHREQTDYFCFVGPSEFRVYLWDDREDSPTRGKSMTFEAGEGMARLVVVPPGVAHAYRNIGTVPGLVFNAPNRLYMGPGRTGEVDEIRHEDRAGSRYRLD